MMDMQNGPCLRAMAKNNAAGTLHSCDLGKNNSSTTGSTTRNEQASERERKDYLSFKISSFASFSLSLSGHLDSPPISPPRPTVAVIARASCTINAEFERLLGLSEENWAIRLREMQS